MPIYEEKIKDKKTGKMIPKLIDGKKQYYIRTYVEDEFGNKKQIWKRNKKWLGNAGKTLAQQEEVRLKSKISTSFDNITLYNLISKFLEYKKAIIKYSSYSKYKYDIENYIKPYFPSNKKADKLTTNDILNWQNALNATTISITTKKRVFTTFSSILKHGCTYYGLQKNVVSLSDNFKDIKGKKKEMNFLTEKEFKEFIKYENDTLYRNFFTLLFYTGMRRGEALALTTDDINLKNNTISINKSYNPKFEGIGEAETTPKTNKSNRNIQMLNIVKEIFKDIKTDGRIFQKVTLTTLKRKCDNNLASAKINKNIRIHDFRHSFASMCIEKEVPIAVISDYLGHENISITLDTYSHLYPNSQEKLLDKLN